MFSYIWPRPTLSSQNFTFKLRFRFAELKKNKYMIEVKNKIHKNDAKYISLMQQSLDKAVIIKSHLNVTLFIDLLTSRLGSFMLPRKYIRLIKYYQTDKSTCTTWQDGAYPIYMRWNYDLNNSFLFCSFVAKVTISTSRQDKHHSTNFQSRNTVTMSKVTLFELVLHSWVLNKIVYL